MYHRTIKNRSRQCRDRFEKHTAIHLELDFKCIVLLVIEVFGFRPGIVDNHPGLAKVQRNAKAERKTFDILILIGCRVPTTNEQRLIVAILSAKPHLVVIEVVALVGAV